ncbi:hypothetical protein THTE_1907 [Thermogutta terrifontis]|uniref:Uncharacterized protein n=1 Tax=Thermogutta terrifontis TaxID=1331910 RepID=A0A286REW5_9BACT|nr:hypothetical protein THTE_1907 [Thermogutta terrifontis]
MAALAFSCLEDGRKFRTAPLGTKNRERRCRVINIEGSVPLKQAAEVAHERAE